VTLSNQAAFGTLRYTTDGHEPGAVAPIYRKPFEVTLPATVRVAAYDTGNRLLAKPRERIIDRTHLLARDGGALANCPGSDFRLRVQPLPDATSMTPVYTLPLFNDCETWKSAPLDGIAAIAFDIARLPDNYQLAHEAKLVVHRATTTAYGELRVHLDTCDGALLATLPLPDPATAPRAFALRAPLAETGHHDLCLAFAVPEGSPLYVFDHVALESATTP
jgi:hexosaminidase